MMPAVQVGPGAGIAGATGGVMGVQAAGAAAPGQEAGGGFGAVMAHAISQAAGSRQGAGTRAQEPMTGGPQETAVEVEAADSGQAQGAAAADMAANSGNVAITVTNTASGSAAARSAMPGVAAQSGTAASAKTVEALAGGAVAVAKPSVVLPGLNVTEAGTRLDRAASATMGAVAETAGKAQGAGEAASGEAGRKADAKKADEKSQPVQRTGMVANGALMLAVSAPAITMAPPAGMSAGAVAGAQQMGGGRAGIVTTGKISLAGGSAAGKGPASAVAATQTQVSAGTGKHLPVAVVARVPISGQSSTTGPMLGGLAAPTGDAGTAAGSAAMAVGADVGSDGGQAAGAQGGSVIGGAGLTASHARDGARNISGGNGSGNPSSRVGFTATLLQTHPGIGQAGGTAGGAAPGFGNAMSVNAGAGPGATAGAHGGVQHAAGSAGGAGMANPYARMDEPQRAALVYASPQKMSVAVSDPGLGNFQVRAQGAGAQVAASLATSSAVTHAQLTGHLPALTAFLQEQRVDVSRVTVVQQSLVGGDAGPRDFGGQQRQGGSGGRGTRAQAGGVGGVSAAGSAGLKGAVAQGAPVGAEAQVDSGGVDAADVPVPRAAGLDDGAMSYVDVHA